MTAGSGEASFLAAHPDYQAVLARGVDSIRARLDAATRIDEPFPHAIVQDLLAPDLYALLSDGWPPTEFFWSDRPHRHDLVPRPPGTTVRDARAKRYDQLPACLRAAWDFFVIDVNRRLVGPFLQRIFRTEIDARLKLIESASAGAAAPPRYLKPPFQPQMNVGRLMMRGYSYQLRPHVDAVAYLATALYYFPQPGDRDTMGTTLFRTERALEPGDLFEDGKTSYFADAGIGVEAVKHVPFVANTLLAFANTGYSAHGMQITEQGVSRRAFQSHLSLKSDRDHL